MGLTVDEANTKANWAIGLSLLALVIAIFSPQLWNMATYSPVYETRPSVVNFPSFAETDAWTRNPNVMPRQLTRQQVRSLHDRHGPVLNFGAQWGPGGDQGSPRPVVKKNWWSQNSY